MNDREDTLKSDKTIAKRINQNPIIVPVVDIYENEDEIVLHADMPGVVKENITIDVDNGTLSIKGVRELKTTGAVSWDEFGDAKYLRTFSVPQTIDIEKINAETKNGVLKLHLPKSEVAKPKQIVIH